MVDDPTPPGLSWPPPGLERMQGDLWRIASRGALGSGLLVLPILFVLTRRADFASLGPLADAWWLTLVLAAVGLAFSVEAMTRTARLSGRTSRALQNGYDLRTVALVVADHRRDMGFLIQGSRWFGTLSPEERRTIAFLRGAAALGHALAGLWPPVALSLGLLLGARGRMTAMGIVLLTLTPAAVGYVVAGICGALEDHRVRGARRAWFQQPWSADVAAGETLSWRRRLAGVRGDDLGPDGSAHWAPRFRRLSVVVVAAAVVAAIPVLTLMPASAVGPVLAMLSVPQYGVFKVRAAQVEVFRDQRAPVDPEVSAAEAGQLLHDLLFVGFGGDPTPGLQHPARRIEAPWLPDGDGPAGPPHRWADTLMGVVADEPSAALVAYLDQVSDHPGLALFRRLAGAGSVDVASARWVVPFADTATMATLAIPRFGGLREATHVQVAAAADALLEGRPDEAERRAREIISVGFLLGDYGNTIIDNVIGHVLIQTGGSTLEGVYRATGRSAQADALARDRELARVVAQRAGSRAPEDLDATLRSIRDAVTDSAAPPGYRWEMLGITATVTPCLRLEGMVLGPGDEYRAFVDEARTSLVRYPSEEPLFDLVRAGYWGAAGSDRFGMLGRVLAVSMRTGPGTCGDLMRRWRTFGDAL
ncbi:MAG: hypothetical protein RJQ04_00875 [Longimicrobiales bacterium]